MRELYGGKTIEEWETKFVDENYSKLTETEVALRDAFSKIRELRSLLMCKYDDGGAGIIDPHDLYTDFWTNEDNGWVFDATDDE